MKTFNTRNLFLTILAGITVEAAVGTAQAQTIQNPPQTASIHIRNWSGIDLIPTRLDSGGWVKFEPSPLRPKKNQNSFTSQDNDKKTFFINNLNGRLYIDSTAMAHCRITVSNRSILNGTLPYAQKVTVRVEQSSSTILHYQADTLEVTAVQASSFDGKGSGPIDMQYLRASSGAYVVSKHTDTTEVLRCVASGMGSISTVESPARQSFDTLWNNSIITVNTLQAYPVSAGNGLFGNVTQPGTSVPQNIPQTQYTSYGNNPRYYRQYASGERIPLKDFIEGNADETDIEVYYSDLYQEKKNGNAFYVEDAIFFGKKPRTQTRFRGQWMGLEFKLPMWGTDFNLLSNYPQDYKNLDLDLTKSVGIAWNVFQLSFGFNSPHWGFVTGAGFLWENYFFNYPDTYLAKRDHRLFVGRDESPERTYKKSKLGVSYFRIPLLFEYTNAKGAWRSVHVSAGVIPSVMMCSWTKQVYRENGKRNQEKAKTDYYVNPFRIDLALYAGWGPFSLFFTYTPTNFFRANRAPGITPFGFGILIGCH